MTHQELRETDIKAIENSLADHDPRLRAAAVKTSRYGKVMNRISAKGYGNYLRDPDPSVRESTLETLQWFVNEQFNGEPDCLSMVRALAPEMRRLLKNPDLEVRTQALVTLGRLREKGRIAVDSAEIDAAAAETVGELSRLLRSKDYASARRLPSIALKRFRLADFFSPLAIFPHYERLDGRSRATTGRSRIERTLAEGFSLL